MKPVTVSIDVPQGREQVYALIDVLANHESFTDHMLVDWECSGPRSGVGARARMRFKRPGPPDWIEMEVTEAEPPRTTTEESVSAGGRRRTRGTYVLEESRTAAPGSHSGSSGSRRRAPTASWRR